MAADVEPPQLAHLLAYAERPRADDWSLRSALTRFAQPQPARASRLIEELRRLEVGLAAHRKTLEQDGPSVWAALQAGDDATPLLQLLRGVQTVDTCAGALTTWAVDRGGERPDAAVDAATDELVRCLDALGIPREQERSRRAPGRARG